MVAKDNESKDILKQEKLIVGCLKEPNRPSRSSILGEANMITLPREGTNQATFACPKTLERIKKGEGASKPQEEAAPEEEAPKDEVAQEKRRLRTSRSRGRDTKRKLLRRRGTWHSRGRDT